MSAISKRFNRVYILDCEFQAADGERQVPVSICALHYVRVGDKFKRAEDVKMFFRDGQYHPCPFQGIESDDTLFIGYNLPAEYKCFLVLGWPLPHNSIDAMAEFKNETCGVWRGADELWSLGYGLEDAVRECGGNPADVWRMPKHDMQNYIRRFGTRAPNGHVEVTKNKKGLPDVHRC